MSKIARKWLLATIMHTIYFFYVMGQGAMGPDVNGKIFVFPFGGLAEWSGYGLMSVRELSQVLLVTVSLLWLLWGWSFVAISSGQSQNDDPAETTSEPDSV